MSPRETRKIAGGGYKKDQYIEVVIAMATIFNNNTNANYEDVINLPGEFHEHKYLYIYVIPLFSINTYLILHKSVSLIHYVISLHPFHPNRNSNELCSSNMLSYLL